MLGTSPPAIQVIKQARALLILMHMLNFTEMRTAWDHYPSEGPVESLMSVQLREPYADFEAFFSHTFAQNN